MARRKTKKNGDEFIRANLRLKTGGVIHDTLCDDVMMIALSEEVVSAIREGAGNVYLTVQRDDLTKAIVPRQGLIPIEASVRISRKVD